MGRRTLAALATLWLLSSASVTLQEPAPAPYRLVRGWGALPGGATWGEVPGMAIDAKGKIFAFHRSEPPIVELDRDGKILKMWGEKLFAWPHGIRVDRFGFLWITDGQNRNGLGQQVFKYKLDDAVAEGVAVDTDGNIYVGETVAGTTLTGQPGGHIVRKLAKGK
ncbi:MAG: hypothetical protein EXQ50_04615 [Acidobacteria bacterium]|nr:hypothetical protein [Acidobacteriota bacterium]